MDRDGSLIIIVITGIKQLLENRVTLYNSQNWYNDLKVDGGGHRYTTVELLNKDTFGTSHFVLYREVVLFQR